MACNCRKRYQKAARPRPVAAETAAAARSCAKRVVALGTGAPHRFFRGRHRSAIELRGRKEKNQTSNSGSCALFPTQTGFRPLTLRGGLVNKGTRQLSQTDLAGRPAVAVGRRFQGDRFALAMSTLLQSSNQTPWSLPEGLCKWN